MRTLGKGLTLIELMVTIAMVTIVILGVGIALVDTQRGWHKMYNRVHGEVATDSYVAKTVFDKVVRKASIKRHILGTHNVTVFYYNDQNAAELDRYANFRVQGRTLFVDYGQVDESGSTLRPSTSLPVARNVEAADFVVDGTCVRMLLKLNDGKEAVTVACSAIRHNE